MFRLTREVRFAINDEPDDQLAQKPSNSYGGFPSLTGLGRYYTLAVTLAGELNRSSNYLRNIKEVDSVVRQRAVPMIGRWAARPAQHPGGPRELLSALWRDLAGAWPGVDLHRLQLALTPLLS